MKALLLLTALIGYNFAIAQHPTCDGTRYTTPQFIPESTTSLLYGNATTIGGANQDLYLDFFEPTGDVAASRPLIIFAFGGSFISGTRQDMNSLCNYFTSLGYATATIDYRLYDGPLFPLPDSVQMTEEVLMATSDMKAAVRYFKEDAANANNFRVDSNYIFVSGISAGGIVASHVALLDSNDVIESYIQPLLAQNGGWTGNSSTNTQHTDKVRGLLSYSGALRKASYIDANDPAIFSVHDDGDDVVPYAAGVASIFGFPIISMEGSYLMEQQAQSAGLNAQLVTIPNSTGHVSYFGTTQGTDSILAMSTDFLFEIVCPQFNSINESEITSVIAFPNPTSDYVTIRSEESSIDAVDIVNQLGAVVAHSAVSGNEIQLQTAHLESGTYFLKIAFENGQSSTQTIVLSGK